MINYSEAKEEAERLSRMLKRNVEVKAFDCDCDYHKNCGTCAGSGTYYQLVYAFCDHLLSDDDRDEQCYENYCAERERVAAVVEQESLPVSHPELKSLSECASEEMEAIA